MIKVWKIKLLIAIVVQWISAWPIKKASGKTPHEVIDETLLKEAYVMLGNPDITISEIAFDLQFNSASAFGRFFKKHTALSPSEYRNKENIQSWEFGDNNSELEDICRFVNRGTFILLIKNNKRWVRSIQNSTTF